MLLEYSGLDPVSPLNAVHAQTGTGTLTPSSGSATGVTAGELLVGAGISNKSFTAAGANYTQRILTSPSARAKPGETRSCCGCPVRPKDAPAFRTKVTRVGV